MPAIIAWVAALLETKIGSWAIQACLALGISFVTYKVGVQPFRDAIVSNLSSMPSMFANVLGYLWVDRALTMIFAAAAAKQATGGLKAVLTKNAGPAQG